MRLILALLVSLALGLAPAASARESGQVRERSSIVADNDAMSDCMKAMQAASDQDGTHNDCVCCDTHSKMPCSDGAACLAKCSTSVIAVLSPQQRSYQQLLRLSLPHTAEKPPDWSLRPPAPPPKA